MQNPGELLDPVTGIGNERALQLKMRQIVNRGSKHERFIITFDIRQFHHMNMVFGVENCNLLLEEIGRYLYQLVGRFQVFQDRGDTFSVIVDTPERSRDIIHQIEQRLSEEWKIKESHMTVEAVIINQHWPGDFSTVEDFFSMREYMLSTAKKSGAKSVVEADEKLLAVFHRRRQVEIAIRRAIQKRSVQVYYQPIFSLKEKRIVSLEALIRMEDEEFGFISPEEFIPLAEKNGSIIQIGEIVLEQCCKFLAKHVLSNTSLGIKTVQINISVVQCMKQDLKESIIPILNWYHIPPSMITLEITESTAISAPALMLRHMKELGELGITFAMDDYGSGNSNCSYLVKFPFKEVKIDKEMTWAYFRNETAKIVLENEIKTMKMLGIPVVVEGIENAEESEIMEKLGVEYIQGYYYGKPLQEKECLRYIRNFNSTPEEFGRM